MVWGVGFSPHVVRCHIYKITFLKRQFQIYLRKLFCKIFVVFYCIFKKIFVPLWYDFFF